MTKELINKVNQGLPLSDQELKAAIRFYNQTEVNLGLQAPPLHTHGKP